MSTEANTPAAPRWRFARHAVQRWIDSGHPEHTDLDAAKALREAAVVAVLSGPSPCGRHEAYRSEAAPNLVFVVSRDEDAFGWRTLITVLPGDRLHGNPLRRRPLPRKKAPTP